MREPEPLFTRARNSLALMIAGGTAAFSAGVFGLTGCSNEAPVQTTAVVAETSTTTVERQGEFTVESLEVEASLLESPEALNETFFNDRMTQWMNAGATADNLMELLTIPGELPEKTVQLIADKGLDTVFLNSLFTSDWEDNPRLVQLADTIIENHSFTVSAYFATYSSSSNAADKEPFSQKSDSKLLKSSTSNGELTLTTDMGAVSNEELNSVGEALTDYQPVNPNRYIRTYTFGIEDGVVKLIDTTFVGEA